MLSPITLLTLFSCLRVVFSYPKSECSSRLSDIFFCAKFTFHQINTILCITLMFLQSRLAWNTIIPRFSTVRFFRFCWAMNFWWVSQVGLLYPDRTRCLTFWLFLYTILTGSPDFLHKFATLPWSSSERNWRHRIAAGGISPSSFWFWFSSLFETTHWLLQVDMHYLPTDSWYQTFFSLIHPLVQSRTWTLRRQHLARRKSPILTAQTTRPLPDFRYAFFFHSFIWGQGNCSSKLLRCHRLFSGLWNRRIKI